MKVAAADQVGPTALSHFIEHSDFFSTINFFPFRCQNQFLLLATNIPELIQELSKPLTAEKLHHDPQPFKSPSNASSQGAREPTLSSALRASLTLW